MKIIMLFGVLGILGAQISVGQTAAPVIVASEASKTPALPQYLVYRHFLKWVSALDKKATADGSSDPYKFAEPFARHAGLTKPDLDAMRFEAKTLEDDLSRQDAQASGAIAAFRAQAKAATQLGQPLPPLPAQIRELQRGRTALLVQHFVNLQTALGPDTTSRLDQYLAREFTPHLRMKRVALPAAGPH